MVTIQTSAAITGIRNERRMRLSGNSTLRVGTSRWPDSSVGLTTRVPCEGGSE